MNARLRQSERATSTAAASAPGWSALLFVTAALLSSLVAAPRCSAAQGNPGLSSLLIEIWPEYDRGAALVILKGELAADTTLPASITLRIPATSGGPAAVAFAEPGKSQLFNLQYEQARSGNDLALRFKAPQRHVQVEFYDPLATNASERNYTYTWPGDLNVERLTVRLQEPAGASDISVAPDLGGGVAGPDGLLYRTADLGKAVAGTPLPIRIHYVKADARTSAEILKLTEPAATAPPATASPAKSAREELYTVLIVLAAAAALVLGGAAVWQWWRVRAGRSAQQTGYAGFCRRCNNRLAVGDRFCPQCGKRVPKTA